MLDAVLKFTKQLVHNYTPIRDNQNFLVDLGSLGDDGSLTFFDRGFVFHRFKSSPPLPCPEPGILVYPGQPESRLVAYITECCIPYPDSNPSGPYSILVLRYEYKTNHRWITKSVDSHVIVHGALTHALDGSLNSSSGVGNNTDCELIPPLSTNTFSIFEWDTLFDEIETAHPLVGDRADFMDYLQCNTSFECLHPLCPPCDFPGYWLYILDDYFPVTPMIPFVLPTKLDDPIQILIEITPMIAGMLGVSVDTIVNGSIDFFNGWLVLTLIPGDPRGSCYPNFKSVSRIAFRYCDCPPGLVYRRGACVEVLECGPCQRWDNDLFKCVDTPCPECPEGSYLVNGECIIPTPSCEDGNVYYASIDDCLPFIEPHPESDNDLPLYDPELDPPRPGPDYVWEPPFWRPLPDNWDPDSDPPSPFPDWEWDGRDWVPPTRDFNPDRDPPPSNPDYVWRGPGWRFPWPDFDPSKDPPNPSDDPSWNPDPNPDDPPSDPIWDPIPRDWRLPNGPCPPGSVNIDGVCQPRDRSCPPGFRWDGEVCVPDPVFCPPQCYWDGTDCVCPDPDNDRPEGGPDNVYRDPYDRDDDSDEDPPYVRPTQPPRKVIPDPRPEVPPEPWVDPCEPPLYVPNKVYELAGNRIGTTGLPQPFTRTILFPPPYTISPITTGYIGNVGVNGTILWSAYHVASWSGLTIRRKDGTSPEDDAAEALAACEPLGDWHILALVDMNPSSVGDCIPKLGLLLWFINRFLDLFQLFENTQYMKYDSASAVFSNRKRSDGPPELQALDLGAKNWAFVHKGEFKGAFSEGSFPWTPCMDYSLTIHRVMTKFIPY